MYTPASKILNPMSNISNYSDPQQEYETCSTTKSSSTSHNIDKNNNNLPGLFFVPLLGSVPNMLEAERERWNLKFT